VGAWYWIGVLAGLGAALGVAAAGILLRWPFAALLGAVVGAAIGFGVLHWTEAVAGGAGAVAGSFGASPLVNGALRRGGTRLGLVVFALLGGLVAAGLAFIPIVGYVQCVLLPAVGLRARRRAPQQHAGLRILARD
jgi:hypothetical protein